MASRHVRKQKGGADSFKSVFQGSEPLPPWEKVLWKRQPYPDNYIDHTFLSSLKRNSNVKRYDYWQLVLSTCAVTQHLSSIVIFVRIFIYLLDIPETSTDNQVVVTSLSPRALTWASIVAFPLGYGMWDVLEGPNRQRKGSHMKAVKSAILVFLILIGTSPVLKTLTEATSSDSVWAVAACLLSLNAVLADYRAIRSDRLTSILSINAGISASAVLASRLKSNLAVLGFTIFAVEIFALFPLLRQRIQSLERSVPTLVVTTALAAVAVFPFASIHTQLALLVATILSFVTFICPAFFIWAQKYKNELKGPWDPAIPKFQTGTLNL